MNKKTIVASLLQIAEDLDMRNMPEEADIVTDVAQSVADAPMSAAEAFRQKLDAAEKTSAMQEERKETVNAIISRLGDLESAWEGTEEQEAELEQLQNILDGFEPWEVRDAPAFDDNMLVVEDSYTRWDDIKDILRDEQLEEQGGPPATTRDLVDMG